MKNILAAIVTLAITLTVFSVGAAAQTGQATAQVQSYRIIRAGTPGYSQTFDAKEYTVTCGGMTYTISKDLVVKHEPELEAGKDYQVAELKADKITLLVPGGKVLEGKWPRQKLVDGDQKITFMIEGASKTPAVAVK